ncbi:hypothetical protein B0A50_04780 [Salinomyces thailandicus]|uniref:Uncharacterized protein n=1 Tax=Salinomyces thailandicus TaxID=706561 RepID=A0A4U0TXB1_9PEZI|nr:hypothetical protein B0A50_04780 [Salinomyces thailandica]
MAALVIAGGIVIANKIKDKKQEKKDKKKAHDDKRYRDLQRETKRRLSRTKSGTEVPAADDGSKNSSNKEDEEAMSEGEASLSSQRDEEPAPPSYTEAEWKEKFPDALPLKGRFK